jgi:predicted exporter
VLIVLILAVQLRNLRATARIAASVVVSMAITAAALVLIEEALTLFHLVALLLAAGVGTNYALFIGMPAPAGIKQGPRDNQPAESAAAPLPVILSVTLAAGTTLIAFATLAMSATPVLHMIGVTVAIGATIALVVSMALAPERARESAAA